MHLSLAALLLAAASAALAAPRHTFHLDAANAGLIAAASGAGAGTNYTWSVTGWDAGCYGFSGCRYDFNITGPPCGSGTEAIPAFAASCGGGSSGVQTGSAFAQCEVVGLNTTGRWVAAELRPSNVTGVASLGVSYRYYADSTGDVWFNYTGFATQRYNQFTGAPLSFSVTPTQMEGVA